MRMNTQWEHGFDTGNQLAVTAYHSHASLHKRAQRASGKVDDAAIGDVEGIAAVWTAGAGLPR
jgi:hypothetical protein